MSGRAAPLGSVLVLMDPGAWFVTANGVSVAVVEEPAAAAAAAGGYEPDDFSGVDRGELWRSILDAAQAR